MGLGDGEGLPRFLPSGGEQGVVLGVQLPGGVVGYVGQERVFPPSFPPQPPRHRARTRSSASSSTTRFFFIFPYTSGILRKRLLDICPAICYDLWAFQDSIQDFPAKIKCVLRNRLLEVRHVSQGNCPHRGGFPSTVSRVLNGKSDSCASRPVRDAIFDAAAALNYRPNQAARLLRTGKRTGKASSGRIILARIRSPGRRSLLPGTVPGPEGGIVPPGFRDAGLLREEEDFSRAKADGFLILGRCSDALWGLCEPSPGTWWASGATP